MNHQVSLLDSQLIPIMRNALFQFCWDLCFSCLLITEEIFIWAIQWYWLEMNLKRSRSYKGDRVKMVAVSQRKTAVASNHIEMPSRMWYNFICQRFQCFVLCNVRKLYRICIFRDVLPLSSHISRMKSWIPTGLMQKNVPRWSVRLCKIRRAAWELLQLLSIFIKGMQSAKAMLESQNFLLENCIPYNKLFWWFGPRFSFRKNNLIQLVWQVKVVT